MESSLNTLKTVFTRRITKIVKFQILMVLCVTIIFLQLFFIPFVCSAPIQGGMFGQVTVIGEPVSAVVVSEGLIPVGEAHTYVYNLIKGNSYHIYLSGDWANPTEHATDYDLFVYRFVGGVPTLISSHTEAAGLIEQVGNDGLDQFFKPPSTGLYYITVRNDAQESASAEAATLMVIEQIETDSWYEIWMEGKVDEQPVPNTQWSYQFVTSTSRLRVYLEVPDTLDMYEARLYVMGNPESKKGENLRGTPVAWEPGLRGKISGLYGGFNLDPKGFRHVDAMASCEKNGDDMVIDYETQSKVETLYHLVFIAEYGQGTIDYTVQTDFMSPEIQLIEFPALVTAGESSVFEALIDDEHEIDRIEFLYSIDKSGFWEDATVDLIETGMYLMTIPAINSGSTIEYILKVHDVLGNVAEINGTFFSVDVPVLEFNLSTFEIVGGEDITVVGRFEPATENLTLFFKSTDRVYDYILIPRASGEFEKTLKPTSIGNWEIWVEFYGNKEYLNFSSEKINFTVTSQPTNITCNVSENTIESGNILKLYGGLTPVIHNVTVELILKTTDQIDKINVKTIQDGSFIASFVAETKGSWTVKASVLGDGYRYQSSESDVVKFEIINPKIITTLSRIPSYIAARVTSILKPPYLYGVIGFFGLVGGGVFIYLRRRE
jgi:hypothetical protein